VSAERITHELVRQVANDLRARYGLDDEDMRALGSRLADSAGTPSTENIEFAKRFTEEHRETFDRLAKMAAQMPPRWQRPLRITSSQAIAPPESRLVPASDEPQRSPAAHSGAGLTLALVDGAVARGRAGW
jgi:hypothetical protein